LPQKEEVIPHPIQNVENPDFMIWMALLIGKQKIPKTLKIKNCHWTHTITSNNISRMYFWAFVSSSAIMEQ